MRMDVFAPEQWDRVNADLEAVWGRTPGQKLQAYGNLARGLFETLLGLAQIYSHKKTIAVVKGNSWSVELMIPYFLREAYSVQALTLEQVRSHPEETVKGLSKDTVFVLFAEDHPLTAETWAWQLFDQALNASKIFSIRVSHQTYISDRVAVLPYSGRFCSIAENLSLCLTGDRFRGVSDLAPYQAWDTILQRELLENRLKERADEKAVLNFESYFPAHQLIPAGHPRYFDRALLSFPDIGGEALVDHLWTTTGLGRGQIISFHRCHWSSLKIYRTWWRPAPSEEIMRGGMAFSIEALQRKDFANDVLRAYENLRGQQSWS